MRICPWMAVWAMLIGPCTALGCDNGLQTVSDPGARIAYTLDMRLLELISIEAGCPLRIRPLAAPGARRLQMLKDGEIDVIAGATASEERQAWAVFSKPYRLEIARLYWHPLLETAQRHASLQALAASNLRVVMPRQAFFGKAFEAIRPQLEREKRLTQTASLAAALLMMRAVPPRAQVLIADDLGVQINQQDYGGVVEASTVQIFKGPIALMLAKKAATSGARERLDAAIDRLRESGRLRAWLTRENLAELAMDGSG